MISKNRFNNIFGFSVFIASILVFLYLSGTVAMAFPLTGVGGFRMEASSASGTNLHIYPSMDETDKVNQTPVATMETSSISFQGFRMEKSFNLNNFSDVSLEGTMRILIMSSSNQSVNFDTAVINVISLHATEAQFNDLEMDENFVPTDSNPLGPGGVIEFTASADSYTLQNPQMQTSRMAVDTLTFPGMVVVVQYDPDNDGTFEFG